MSFFPQIPSYVREFCEATQNLTDYCWFKVNLGCYHFGFNQYFFWVSNHWFWNSKNWPDSNLRFYKVQYAVVLNLDLKQQFWTWENNWFYQTWTYSRFKTNLKRFFLSYEKRNGKIFLVSKYEKIFPIWNMKNFIRQYV